MSYSKLIFNCKNNFHKEMAYTQIFSSLYFSKSLKDNIVKHNIKLIAFDTMTESKILQFITNQIQKFTGSPAIFINSFFNREKHIPCKNDRNISGHSILGQAATYYISL